MVVARVGQKAWMYSSERMPSDAWDVVRVLVFLRDGHTCRWCGTKTCDLHCDHIVPLAKGGTNHPYNLHTLCGDCNKGKNTHVSGFAIKPGEWRIWDTLIRHEPRLVDVYQKARDLRDNRAEPAFCANEHFYGWGGLKRQLSDLVGYSQRGDLILGTSEAYDTAYHVIYNALPCCRNCWRG